MWLNKDRNIELEKQRGVIIDYTHTCIYSVTRNMGLQLHPMVAAYINSAGIFKKPTLTHPRFGLSNTVRITSAKPLLILHFINIINITFI